MSRNVRISFEGHPSLRSGAYTAKHCFDHDANFVADALKTNEVAALWPR